VVSELKKYKYRVEWIWITGGEPADHNLQSLLSELVFEAKLALVTSGRKVIPDRCLDLIDFLSVSPHGPPSKLQVTQADQVNLVPGLGGTTLEDWEFFNFRGFTHKWVTPLEGSPESVQQCLQWVQSRSEWRMGIQAHKVWGVA
jgi:organic radical activating enzyme